MKIEKKPVIKMLAACALVACAFGNAIAAEVAGIKFADTVKVAGKDLKLNGLGLRTKFFVKVYAAGLYLPEKSKNVVEIIKTDVPRRMSLVLIRDIGSEEFGSAYMQGLNNNLDKTEKSKLLIPMSKVGEIFASMEGLKKGDVLNLDWVPGAGSVYELNGKKLGETIPDVAFYNATLRIWLGDKPVDSSLKPQLLGEK